MHLSSPMGKHSVPYNSNGRMQRRLLCRSKIFDKYLNVLSYARLELRLQCSERKEKFDAFMSIVA